MSVFLIERLTFDRLFRISEPKRVYRSFTVRGPPLEIDTYQDVVYYIFNFKANPSTTGLRHRGYVKFFKPLNKNPKNVPLQHLECLVDCTCPDFRYRWAWANKQRQSSVVGPQSLNQAWNRAPRKTNPKGAPGLCKHILATRQHIYGLLSSFPGDEPDTAYKLDRLTKYATKRWTDFEGQLAAAKAKEQEIRRRRELRNTGQLPDQTIPPPVDREEEPQEPGIDAPAGMPTGQKPDDTAELKSMEPEPLPLAIPPGQRGRTFPKDKQELAVPPGQRGRNFPNPAPTHASKSKRVIGNRVVNPPLPESSGWIRPHEAAVYATLRNLILESVVTTNGESMNAINEALKLVEDMETDELNHAGSGGPPPGMGGDMGGGGEIGGETLEPMEPPVSDSAIGADTEGDSALSLLRSMKMSLEQIAAAIAPPMEELPPGEEGALEGGMGGAGGPGGEGEIPMPDEPPVDADVDPGAESAETQDGEKKDEGGEGREEKKPDDDDDEVD